MCVRQIITVIFRPAMLFCFAMLLGCDGDKQDPVFVSDGDVGAVNFISDVQPILETNCLRCHSISKSGGERNGAPLTVNFDTYENVVNLADRANARIQSGTMPPGSGLPDTDRVVFSDWVTSGMPMDGDSTGEFIAIAENFKGYESWNIADNTIFPTNLGLLGTAHQANDSDYTRWIYATRPETVEGKYPTGTILLKETFTWSNTQKQYAETGGILAMVKRGNGFNPDAGGWEWFELSPGTLEIAARGGEEMMGGGCNACHKKATDPSAGEDFVFTHPSQYEATADDFSKFSEWPVIGEGSGAGNMLGNAHQPEAVRKIYRRQLQANPNTVLRTYPVGTTIVKQVTDGDQVVEITAMVKRGDAFDSDNGNWEWFMLDPSDLSITGRGASLMEGMCRSCHTQANAPDVGFDYVFAHSQDPFSRTYEFIATDEAFTGFSNWTAVDNTTYPANSDLLGGAHQANDPDYSRWVFATNPSPSEDGAYPVGAMLVKETFTWSGNQQQYSETGGILAMAKRGGDFNSQANGWEWFLLDPTTRKIASRGGADMTDGACNSCHSGAVGEPGADYVFTHPAEYAAGRDDFQAYAAWTLIGEASGEYDLLQGAHKANTTRRVYKRQLQANPDTAFNEYPVGTTLVKEVLDNGEILEITAMVKRGNQFNGGHNNWEWFMLNPGDLTIQGRGADLLGDMCNNCHVQALSPDIGLDYVFAHPDDPFNNGTREFIAVDSDFADYQTWQIADSTIFPTNRDLLGTAHQANSSDYTRQVFASPRDFVGGAYPVGTRIVKETFTWTGNDKQFAESGGILAMAKRGTGFNPSVGDWEWFELDPNTRQIIGRGGSEMMGGGCNGCHASATGGSGTDFVFTHPGELTATAADFADYATWALMGEQSGAATMLGTAHQPEAVRRIYRLQLPANPKGATQQYPTGTMIVKEVTDGATVVEITAMVKRGDKFNPGNNNWEWFMLNPRDLTIAGRGGDLMDGMCASCHSQAITPGNGVDYVFAHANDPYNNIETTYTNDILPLIFQGNCLGCHAGILESGAARNFAPVNVNFDTYTDAVNNSQRANQRVQAGTMPPSGALFPSDMALFNQWLNSGTPE